MQTNAAMKLLFERGALELSPADEPFWYTSGNFGPYYINTHYLFGGAEHAKKSLQLLNDPDASALLAFQQLVAQELQDDPVYRDLMQALAQGLEKDYALISGGARRDFFFSFAIAFLLKKPHLAFLKDGRSFWLENNECKEIPADKSLEGPVLHVADLLTAGSSYLRAWLPMLRAHGLTLKETLVIVDRDQSGRQALEAEGVKVLAGLRLDDDFFLAAQKEGYLDENQRQRIMQFRVDPDDYMDRVLEDHPPFLDNALHADEKTRVRAQRFLELQKN